MLFTCPYCESHDLECILDGIHHCTAESIEEGEIIYKEIESEAEVDRFQCDNCGFVLKDENDDRIITEEGVVKWIEKHCK